MRKLNSTAALQRNTSSVASTLARIDVGEPADPDAAPRARFRQDGVGVGAPGVVAAAVADIAHNAVAVLLADEVRRNNGVGARQLAAVDSG